MLTLPEDGAEKLKHGGVLIKYFNIQGPPKKCTHTLTKENYMLYNRLL